jgi:pyrroline-5-carboxylate reductase
VSGKRLKQSGQASSIGTVAEPVVIVGAGNMGGAIALALAANGDASHLLLIDPAPGRALAESLAARGARFATDAAGLTNVSPTAILLAIKPQLMAQVAPSYAPYAQRALFISVAAGTTLQSLDTWLAGPAALVRCMPNLPASIGMGVTAAVARQGTPASAKAMAEQILRTVGDFIWLEDEAQLDAVTAVSGSGPAYVFHLVECLAAAGIQQGLPEDVANLLARRTIEGAGALLGQSTSSPAELRTSVTSPGGTTEAALRVLMDNRRTEKLFSEAVASATQRARELSK